MGRQLFKYADFLNIQLVGPWSRWSYSSRRSHHSLLWAWNRKSLLRHLDGMVLFGGILAHFEPQPLWVLLLNMSLPLWPQCARQLTAGFSRITRHATKLNQQISNISLLGFDGTGFISWIREALMSTSRNSLMPVLNAKLGPTHQSIRNKMLCVCLIWIGGLHF